MLCYPIFIYFQDTQVTATTSGNGHVVLCDYTGWAHLISRSWEITSFKAYELTVSLAQQLPHDPFLVTIGVSIFFIYFFFINLTYCFICHDSCLY